MGVRDRGLYIVESEISVVLTAMRRGNLWSSNTHQDANTENLIKEFNTLKKSLGSVSNFSALDTVEFLMPFLDVIRSEDVTGHVTGLALTAVNKFLAYEMIDVDKPNVSSAVENLADAVTHARFVGSDPGSDEVVLMKILEVLKLLILSRVGLLLTNESICEIMQSTLRICFEPRLSELLRKTAQHCLTDMVQLLFTRLPTFTESQKPLLKKLKMRSSALDKAKRKSKTRMKKSPSPAPKAGLKASSSLQSLSTTTTNSTNPIASPQPSEDLSSPTNGAAPSFSVGGEVLARSPVGSVADLSVVSDSELTGLLSDGEQGAEGAPAFRYPSINTANAAEDAAEELPKEPLTPQEKLGNEPVPVGIQVTSPEGTVRPPASGPSQDKAEEFTNEAGVTFTTTADTVDANGSLVPYGLPAVYELLRFLASLINPHEPQNTEAQIQIGLSLISCALEVGVDAIGNFASLMGLVKDEMCRNLIALLSVERVAMFSASLRCCFLLFDGLRSKLKFQLEQFLTKLSDIINSESNRIAYEHKELSLEQIVLLYKMPGFITELYLNYDCGLYTTNLFEDLTKVLSKNAFPVAGLLSTHHLALEGLLVVLDSIEKHCQQRISDRVPQPPVFLNNSGDSQFLHETLERQQTAQTLSIMERGSGHIFAVASTYATALEAAAVNSGKLPEAIIPTHESLMAIKHKKKLLTNGTEQFNVKPSKGIEYLQENRLLSKPTDPREVAHFLRENPHLCKNMVGEYISNKKNLDVLKSFVKSFDFRGMRIDEALRQFLQTFRLPGEAPLISMIMEIFGEHWHLSNEECLADADAPYTLAYAVIMLNTDQHNPNASKQNVPMTCDQFVKNLRGTNGGGDHDPEMLAEIYHAIRNDEIVMPAEQTGLVKENYMWKQLLKRGQEEGNFVQMDNGMFDHNLFGLSWGPAVAALSYIFDKSNEPDVLRRVLDGFSKCAMVAAHYAMSDVLDNLVISLTKFTTLLHNSGHHGPDSFKIAYGANSKALLATRAVFSLTHKYGDILREGWRNLVECLLQLFKCQLLPTSMMEAEDYIESSGRISLYREELPREKADSGLINSLVSFIVASSEAPRSLSKEEEECVELAKQTVAECHPEHLLAESKFLLTESLQELVRFLIAGSSLDSSDEKAEDHATLFYLELITRITIANRDRVLIIWRGVSDHISRLISATAPTLDTLFELERAVTALLRLAVRLARKEEIASTVVQSLRILLAMKPGSIFHVAKQVSYGLYELLRNNAANIHSAEDWAVIFSLLEVVGAGASPDTGPGLPTDEDSGQGADSDDGSGGSGSVRDRAESGGWIDLGREETIALERKASNEVDRRYSIVHPRQILMHDSISFLKSCESLSFLVRDVAHITPENFHTCIAAIRTFVEASYKAELNSSRPRQSATAGRSAAAAGSSRSAVKRPVKSRSGSHRRIKSEPRGMDYDADEEEEEDLVGEYTHVTLQLLDLMHTLHTRAAGVHQAWAAEGGGSWEGELWDTAWCPVLQGMARLCCDKRAEVRTQALNLLQRSLLVPDLQVLQPAQWEFCFLRVLFPMLRKLLEPATTAAPGMSMAAREETKLRAAMMLSKVFLQHLGPLSSLPTFTALWLTILDFLAQFIGTASSDLLADALPESLKNMLLVMDTSGRNLFFAEDTGLATPLWTVTWEKIDSFLPGLKQEVFGERDSEGRINRKATPTEPPGTKTADQILADREGQLNDVFDDKTMVTTPQVEKRDEELQADGLISATADQDLAAFGRPVMPDEEQEKRIGGGSGDGVDSLASYFSQSSSQFPQAASLLSRDSRYPSLPLLCQNGGSSADTGSAGNPDAFAVGPPVAAAPGAYVGSQVAAAALSLPSSPLSYTASRGMSGFSDSSVVDPNPNRPHGFTPIMPAPPQDFSQAAPPVIAAPTPVVMLPPLLTPDNPIVISPPQPPPPAVPVMSPGTLNTAFAPANPLLFAAGATPRLPTILSPPTAAYISDNVLSQDDVV